VAHAVLVATGLTPTMPADTSAPTATHAGTLRDLLRLSPRLAPDRAARLLAGVARAAAAWHGRGTAYGALTPDRVLVGPGDVVALAPPPRADGAPAPWPTYLAPEQIDGRAGDARSDVYALGLIGWEMLAGQQPWEGESLYGVVVKQREHDLPRLSTLRPGLPRALVVALEGCLHKAPGDRWQTMAEFAAALEPALAVAGPLEPAHDRAAGRAAGGGPGGPVAGVVARAAAAGAVPGASGEAGSAPAARPRPHVEADEDDRSDRARTPTSARRGDPPRRWGRWLAAAVLALALVGAAGAAVVVVQGRKAVRVTRTWLDSLSTPPAGAGDVGAAAATTTNENTTAAPVRRTEPTRPEPEPDEAIIPPADDTAAALEPGEAPVLEPTPPFTPPRPARPIRPTVPQFDTLAVPDSLSRR
jgi:serine/threonine-protein kinase